MLKSILSQTVEGRFIEAALLSACDVCGRLCKTCWGSQPPPCRAGTGGVEAAALWCLTGWLKTQGTVLRNKVVSLASLTPNCGFSGASVSTNAVVLPEGPLLYG